MKTKTFDFDFDLCYLNLGATLCMYYATLCSGIIFIVMNFYLCIAMNGTILLIFIICQFLFMYVFILFCNFSIFL